MNETVRATHKRELNESSAPQRPQMMSPDMAVYIQAPGVGHYLQSDKVNFVFLN